jgi:alpha-D-ribose 1-methylphosphonate 5-triphosphate synthase subunit PhnI
VTDGERIVWGASYALALERTGDSVVAALTAARAVEQLREAPHRRLPDGTLAISQIDDRDFLDEIVSIP